MVIGGREGGSRGDGTLASRQAAIALCLAAATARRHLGKAVIEVEVIAHGVPTGESDLRSGRGSGRHSYRGREHKLTVSAVAAVGGGDATDGPVQRSA